MNKKLYMIFIGVICVLIVFTIAHIKNTNQTKENDGEISTENLHSYFDEESGLYYLKNEETGEIIQASRNEDDLQFFLENPDYNPDPLTERSTNLEDFINYGAEKFDNEEVTEE